MKNAALQASARSLQIATSIIGTLPTQSLNAYSIIVNSCKISFYHCSTLNAVYEYNTLCFMPYHDGERALIPL